MEKYYGLSATVKLSKEFQNKVIDVDASLVESGAFAYGNGTATVLIATDRESGKPHKRVLDTRYVTGIKKEQGFRQFVFDELSAYYGENAVEVTVK